MVQEGYEQVSVLMSSCSVGHLPPLRQYHGAIFKVPMMTQWMIVVASPQLIDDIRRASDDQLSLKDAIAEVIHCGYCYFLFWLTLATSHSIATSFLTLKCMMTIFTSTSLSLISQETSQLAFQTSRTRSRPPVQSIYPRREMVRIHECVYENTCWLKSEWTTIVARKTAMSIVCRTVNRLLVGLPLCKYQAVFNSPLPDAQQAVTQITYYWMSSSPLTLSRQPPFSTYFQPHSDSMSSFWVRNWYTLTFSEFRCPFFEKSASRHRTWEKALGTLDQGAPWTGSAVRRWMAR